MASVKSADDFCVNQSKCPESALDHVQAREGQAPIRMGSTPADMKRPMSSANLKESMCLPKPVPMKASTKAIDRRSDRVRLYDGKNVDSTLYRRVKQELLERIPGLVCGDLLEMKAICSPEFWESLKRGEKLMAGRCLMHLVVRNEVKLALVSRNTPGSQLYSRVRA